MLNLDFAAAKLRHTSWKLKVRRFLDGEEALTLAQATDHHLCEVGRWLHAPGSGGLARWSGHPTVRPSLVELDQVHGAMHAAVKRVIEAKLAGRLAEAEAAFVEAEKLSSRVVELLSAIEPVVERHAA